MSFEKAIGMDNSVNAGGVAIDGFHSHHCEYRWAAKHYSDLEPTHTHTSYTLIYKCLGTKAASSSAIKHPM